MGNKVFSSGKQYKILFCIESSKTSWYNMMLFTITHFSCYWIRSSFFNNRIVYSSIVHNK